MKILIVGAGALGGYFGARLLQAQQDVTFLLRPGRAAQLRKTGLVVKSRHGDLALPAPPHVLAADIVQPYDVVVVACKAYDLEQTMASFAPAVGPDTMILPLLNGMQHIDQLGQRFGAQQVLGGICLIAATLDADGTVRHLNDAHQLRFGERDGANSARVQALAAVLAQGAFDSGASSEIMQEMWEKWVFIAATAGITCLMRGAVGDILAGGGLDLTKTLLAECGAIADANGYAPRPAATERALKILTEAGSAITASMLRDIQNGAAIEADHIIGDLISRGGKRQPVPTPLLRVVYAHLKTYEARRLRELPAAP